MSELYVKNAVVSYLTKEFVNKGQNEIRYTVREEYPIQIGSSRRRADVALLAGRKLLAVVECKKEGKIGEGIKQLQSYLYASPAQLGVFANSVSPDNWKYYQKLPNEEVKFIRNRHVFQELVRKSHKDIAELEAEIEKQRVEHVTDQARSRVTLPAIQERTDQIIEEEAKKRVTETAIYCKVSENLQKEIKNLKSTIEKQREEINSQTGCMVWGWIL
ncbi:type I restriction enzyme HsdR N-terminal domain-containing protein, partial [Candidatus Poribacteria bacterium]|nr:type I restriction enzyme HsdR N-terminal domain-containing protein [Candidatus Poribacteria bacterium]